MFRLDCPQCQAALPVSPAKAGGEISCPTCQAVVPIPKLGELRQLPRIEEDVAGSSRKITRSGENAGSPLPFLTLALVAVGCLIAAGFCGIRWATIEVPATTESHIESIQNDYFEVESSVLLDQYEDMQQYGMEIGMPYKYQLIADRRDAWARSGLTAAGVGGVALLGSMLLAVGGRRRIS
ncbi:MAG: hypothetical protein AAF958_00415 [Planctomycetota bacterium]